MAYDDQQQNDPRATAISGQLPQAAARLAAPRGGTPNAPETPNTTGGIPRGQQFGAMGDPGYFSAKPIGNAIAAVKPYIPGGAFGAQMGGQVAAAYRGGGVGAAIGEGARQLIAAPVAVAADIARPALPAFDAAAQGLKTLVTGDSSPIPSAGGPSPPATPAAPATPSSGGYGMGDRGPGYTPDPYGAPPEQAQSVAVPAPGSIAAPQQFAPGTDPISVANDRARAALDVYRARDEQAFQDRRNNMLAQANAANASTDLERQRGETRVADWNRANSADVVLRGGTGAERAGIARNADVADARLAGAEGRSTAANAALAGPSRNYLDEAQKGQAIVNSASAEARTAQNFPLQQQLLHGQVASQNIAQQVAAIGLQGTKDQQALVKQIYAEQDPDKQQRLVTSLLAAQGKAKPETFDLAHVKGGTDPSNPLVTLPDQAYLVNKNTGAIKRVDTQPGTAGAAAAKPPSLDEFMKQARADPRNKGFDDAYLQRYYQANYGGK